MRIRAAWWVGVIVYLIYNSIIFATWFAAGADYRHLVDGDVIFKSIVLPLSLGAVFLIAAVSWLGWWRPVLAERRRGRPVWALWPVLAIMLGFIAVNAVTTNWSAIAAEHLLLLAAAGVLVGFNEETLNRGVLVTGWRGSASGEVWVWFWTTLLFGLMHLPNGFFGIGLAASSAQVVFAFLAGCGLYLLRRLSGTLILPMALHGAWDFATFSHLASGAAAAPSVVYWQIGTYLLSIVLLIVVLRAGPRPA